MAALAEPIKLNGYRFYHLAAPGEGEDITAWIRELVKSHVKNGHDHVDYQVKITDNNYAVYYHRISQLDRRGEPLFLARLYFFYHRTERVRLFALGKYRLTFQILKPAIRWSFPTRIFQRIADPTKITEICSRNPTGNPLVLLSNPRGIKVQRVEYQSAVIKTIKSEIRWLSSLRKLEIISGQTGRKPKQKFSVTIGQGYIELFGEKKSYHLTTVPECLDHFFKIFLGEPTFLQREKDNLNNPKLEED